jgi:hypothetical protein
MSDDNDDPGPSDAEYYEERRWAKDDIARIARKEAKQYIDRKRETLLEDFGAFVLEGGIRFRGDGQGGADALVDRTEVASFLRTYFENGDDVKLLVMQAEEDEP